MPRHATRTSYRLGREFGETAKAVVKADAKSLHWAAGFLEGEGYFLSTRPNSSTVSVTQKQREPLERLLRLFGGRVKPGGKDKAYWVWQVYGSGARGVTMTLYSLMSPRRQEQMCAALGFQRKAA